MTTIEWGISPVAKEEPGGGGARPPGLMKLNSAPPCRNELCLPSYSQWQSFSFCQLRSMKKTREFDLVYLSYETKVLMEDITFDELLTEWSSKPRKLGN